MQIGEKSETYIRQVRHSDKIFLSQGLKDIKILISAAMLHSLHLATLTLLNILGKSVTEAEKLNYLLQKKTKIPHSKS